MCQAFHRFISRLLCLCYSWADVTKYGVRPPMFGWEIFVDIFRFLQVIFGMQIALSIRIGQLLGEQDKSGAKTVARLAIVILG